jgi:hypothetical protein
MSCSRTTRVRPSSRRFAGVFLLLAIFSFPFVFLDLRDARPDVVFDRGMIARSLRDRLLSTARVVFWWCARASPCVLGSIASTHGLFMLAKLASYTLVGIDATPVEVEVDVSFAQMPKTVLVGLAETA